MFQLSEVILQHRPDLKINFTTTYVPVVQPGAQRPRGQEPEPLAPESLGQEAPV